jgi:hypothetical protein
VLVVARELEVEALVRYAEIRPTPDHESSHMRRAHRARSLTAGEARRIRGLPGGAGRAGRARVNGEPERLRSLQIDHQLELVRCSTGKSAGLTSRLLGPDSEGKPEAHRDVDVLPRETHVGAEDCGTL